MKNITGFLFVFSFLAVLPFLQGSNNFNANNPTTCIEGEVDLLSLQNPDFEIGNTTGWNALGTCDISASSTAANGGAYSCLIENRSQNWNGVEQSIINIVQQGIFYEFTAWAKVKTPLSIPLNDVGHFSISITIDPVSGSKEYPNISSVRVYKTGWIKIRGYYRFDLPISSYNDITLKVLGPNAAVDFYVDDIAIDSPLSYSPSNSSPADFVHTSGQDLLVNGSNTPLKLQGINFWAYSDDLGEDPMDVVFNSYKYDWGDYAKVAALGYNCVRLNMDYRAFEDDSAPYTYKQEGWEWLERNIIHARNSGIYLILDMHTPQGGYQSYGFSGSFWGGGSSAINNRDRLKALWAAIATRYKDESAIAGFDLINEALPPSASSYYNYIQELVNAIRVVDNNHMIIVEQGFTPGGGSYNHQLVADPNVMYDSHYYYKWSYSSQLIPNYGGNNGGNYPDPSTSFDKNDLETSLLDEGLQFCIDNNVPHNAGEFGLSKYIFPTPSKGALTWMTDVYDLHNTHKVSAQQWTLHSTAWGLFTNEFGFPDDDYIVPELEAFVQNNNTTSFSIGGNCDPQITVNGNANICSGGSLTLDAGVGYNSYLWSTGETTQNITVSTSGNYAVTTTDSNACTGSVSTSVNLPDPIVLTIIGTNASNGNNGSADLTVTGGTSPYNYLWSNGATTEDVSGLAPDTYTVTVTDNHSCTEIENVTISGGSGCNFITINSEGFEPGWGIWNDGGTDARRSSNDAVYANNGTYCVRLRDNTDGSTTTTKNMDLSGFGELMIDFSYYALTFEGVEDFWLQVSTDGGATFTTLEDWVHSTDFNNDERQNTSVIIPGPFTATTQLRFRCDATGNSDKVYIDDINISGCPNTGGYNLITSINGNGTISLNPSGGTYTAGTQVTITATPDASTQFNTWSGDISGSINPITVTMMSNMNITANFSSIGGCSYSTIDNQDFESGWGIWNDGGNDARRSSSDAAYANNGTYCVRLRNDTEFSVMTTDSLDLSAYDELTVEFSYYALSFEEVEDFWLQISTDGGATFTTVADWVRGTDFYNEERHNVSAIITGTFSSATQLRIRCDASGSSDKVYIDDVVIKGCATSSPLIISNDSDAESAVSIDNSMKIRENEDINNPEVLKMDIYPNPASSKLTIAYQTPSSEKVEIIISDFTGKVLRRIESLGGTYNKEVDLSEITNGYYLLHLVSGKERMIGKFVVLRK